MSKIPENGELDLDATVVASLGQVSCDLDEDAVVLNLGDGVYYGLNPVAARIWSLLQEPIAVLDVRDRLLDEYDVEAERCTAELMAVLSEFRERGLIEFPDAPVGAEA